MDDGDLGAEPSERVAEVGRPAVVLVCGSLVYYHCAYRDSSLLSLAADVLIVLLCSLAILGMLFRQLNISMLPSTNNLYVFCGNIPSPRLLKKDNFRWTEEVESASCS